MMNVLDTLPDEAASVEARAMILSGRGQIVWRDESGLMLLASREQLASIVGAFRWASIARTLDELGRDIEIVARESEFQRAGPLPPGWIAETAIVHEEPQEVAVPPAPRAVTFFNESDTPDLRHVPMELRRELEDALAFSPVAAALDGDVPVSFCYSGWETETLWDVSIDTLAPWRKRGFAAAAAVALMTHMRQRGKRAAWAALESNVPSLAVARRLGFRPVGRLAVIRRYRTRRGDAGTRSSNRTM
jgi:RimJ/RimL family protein N-acetyltransferase